jgi:hypothetical protein
MKRMLLRLFAWMGRGGPLARRFARFAPWALGLGVVAWFWPALETIPGPRLAILRNSVAGLELGVTGQWYDLGLNRRASSRTLAFDADGTAILPDYRLPTHAGRIVLKRVLTRSGWWSACEHCYGPIAHASLYRRNDYAPPAKTRLAQNAEVKGDVIEFTVSLLADEAQFEERPLVVNDLDALLAEARMIIAAAENVNVDPARYGEALRRLNPVRAEIYRGALLVWMGGKAGYSLNPDSEGGPLINGAFVSGTEYAGIQKIERM